MSQIRLIPGMGQISHHPKLTFAQLVVLIALNRTASSGIPYDNINSTMKALIKHGFIGLDAGRAYITEAGKSYFTTK